MTNPASEHQTSWTFMSNHAHVLVCLLTMDNPRVREIAERVGITDRMVQNVLADLEGAGFIERRRNGRRNEYTLHLEHPLRHPLEAHKTAGELLSLIVDLPLPPEAR